MKNTFLVRKQNDNGEIVLTEVSAAEWFSILAETRKLPKEQHRYFIADCIEDGDEMDRMFIEVSREEHHRWNSKHTVSERNRKYGKEFIHLSLDDFLARTLVDTHCVEDDVASQILIMELKCALRLWKPWAMDLYDAYLAGRRKKCTAEIAQKYGVSPQTARSYKRQFEAFVINFLI